MFLKKATLQNFFGFSNSHDVTFEQFTVLTGPNNGGKTSILRAIQFALGTFRLYFGDGHEPDLTRIQPDWFCELDTLRQRLGMQDANLFYHGRSRHAPSSATLAFASNNDAIELTAQCESTTHRISIELVLNGDSLRLKKGTTCEDVVKSLYRVVTQFIPPLGTLSPTERELSWPDLQGELAKGRYAETWRNQLHWQTEGQSPEQFQRVAKTIREHLGEIDILTPKRTRSNSPPNVVVEYREQGVEYDISAGGGGLRTLVSLAAAVELSPARILLFDEPDAHLHSSLQRRVAKLLFEQSGPER